jgi:hypothetical protein
MAESSGFFKSINDRKYTVDWLAKYIASFIGNGVYNGELAVTADGSAMSVTLPSGRAWINGYHYRNDGDMTLTIDNADGVLNRVDIVVLRWDVNARSITAQVIKGTPASTAAAPAITRTVEQYDLKLAEISIPAGTTAISQALITDCRLDNSVCGIVTGVLDQVDTTTFYSQIQADLAAFKSGSEADFSTWSEQQKASFDSWFSGIKDILGEDEAANLLNLIEEHKADAVSHVTQSEHDSIASAVQGATLGGAAVPKSGTTLEFPNLVQGNAKSWIATSVKQGSTENLYWTLYVKLPANVEFTEGCQVTFQMPSTLDFTNISATNAWNIRFFDEDDNTLFGGSFRLMQGSADSNGYVYKDSIPLNQMVTVTLSKNIADPGSTSIGTAFLKSGTAADTTSINSALTLSTVAPTAMLKAGKLWGVY